MKSISLLANQWQVVELQTYTDVAIMCSEDLNISGNIDKSNPAMLSADNFLLVANSSLYVMSVVPSTLNIYSNVLGVSGGGGGGVAPANPHDLGWYADLPALQTAHPVGAVGDYALLETPDAFFKRDTGTSSRVNTGSGASPKTMISATDPATDAALTTAIVDGYNGTIITTTGPSNSQTFQDPTNTTPGQMFTVVNNDTSTDPIDIIANSQTNTLDPGQGATYLWDGTKRILVDLISASDITAVPFDTITGLNVQTQLQQINTKVNGEKNGFDLVYNQDKLGQLSFVDATRTFSIAPIGGQPDYAFFINGIYTTKTTTESVVIPNITGIYYIYFDNNGVLQYKDSNSLDLDVFYKNALVGLVYWNATEGYALMPSNERHGYRMNSRDHNYEHSTLGARFGGGYDITGLVSDGDNYTNLGVGTMRDEDIEHKGLVETTTEFWYRKGTNGEWTKTAADNKVGYKEGGATYRQRNEFDGTTWKLTEGTSSTDFFITFFVAVPGLDNTKVVKIIGQNAYANKTAARNNIDKEIQKLSMDGLPSPEYVFLYAMIVKRTEQLKTLDDGSLYLDLRYVKGIGGSPSNNVALRQKDEINGVLSPLINSDNLKVNQIYHLVQTLTSGANVDIDWNNGSVAELTLGENANINNSTNLKEGTTYMIKIIQDGTGNRTLSRGTQYKWVGGTAPILSASANAIDIITFMSDGTNLYGVGSFNFS